MPPLAIHLALGLALAESVGLALLLALRARGVAGGRLLVLFMLGVGVWISGNELPAWFGPDVERLAGRLIAFASLTSVVFLHFAIRFCNVAAPRVAIASAYALGFGTTVVAILLSPGGYGAWGGLPLFFQPNALGWVVGLMWALFGTLGHLVMLLSWTREKGLRRRQIAAVFAASALGLISMTGYAFAAWGWDVYPYPLLLLPAYPLILVYGILRYQLMIVNSWARRAVAFTLLAGSGTLAIAILAVLPFPLGAAGAGWRAWMIAIVALVVSLSLVDPFRRLALRIVYPGSDVTAGVLESWRGALSQANDFAALSAIASTAISGHLRTPVAVIAGGDGDVISDPGLFIFCRKIEQRWRVDLVGWDSAPPGPRYVATLFGAILTEAARELDQAMTRALTERERQQQARLAELGGLAAIVAHDIRNPLNIIAMAAATTSFETRAEIGVQVKRITQLSQDLLDYAKSWQLDRRRFDLADHIRKVAEQYPEIEFGPALFAELIVDGDPRRISQIVTNLIDNARAARKSADDPVRIAVEADRGGDGSLQVHICDDGIGIAPDIRETLFQPFVSRRPSGTGLGLAIVAKIMEAHGGSSELTERAGWSTCFTLSFPAPRPP